jgi:glycosyltransferase involved in cell wall biosynthesis
MRVIQVVPRIAASSSGPSYSVSRLSESLQDAGAEVQLHVLEPLPAELPNVEVRTYPTRRFPGAWRLGWSPEMKKGLVAAARDADIIHNHGMWMMPNIYCHEAARTNGCRLIFSPRGTLSDWALNRSRFRKRLVWWGGQKGAVQAADRLHATSEKEGEEIRRFGLHQAIVVVPNGVDVPRRISRPPNARQERTLLFLSRIHPAKNLDRLLVAWAELQGVFPSWRLTIAGPDSGGYARRMRVLARSLGLNRVQFAGEVTGLEKSELLAQADLFVLPTQTENFAIAVAEALAHGTPAIVTRGAPWAGLEAHGCGWWIEHGQAVLTGALRTAMVRSPRELDEMGERGRQWMLRDFSWQGIGDRMLEAYHSLLAEAGNGAGAAAAHA